MILNNLIEVFDDSKLKWREARVIQIDRDNVGHIFKIKIHFKGLNKKFDEVIDRQNFDRKVKSVFVDAPPVKN